MTFQYSNFGVPDSVCDAACRRRRGRTYATALAAMFDPVAAVQNFRALVGAGADGQYGFYESVDYTPTRLPPDTAREVVRMYMAHHQGMAIVAIGNILQAGAMRARFHAEPIVRASELLLQERTPRDVAVARPRRDTVAVAGDVRAVPPFTRHFVRTADVAPCSCPTGAMP
jgi:cyclic beta-1,2-glucan synthetase